VVFLREKVFFLAALFSIPSSPTVRALGEGYPVFSIPQALVGFLFPEGLSGGQSGTAYISSRQAPFSWIDGSNYPPQPSRMAEKVVGLALVGPSPSGILGPNFVFSFSTGGFGSHPQPLVVYS